MIDRYAASEPDSDSGADKVEVIGRGMVLRKESVRRAAQAADGQVEPWRAVLPLVVSVGREVKNLEPLGTVRKHGQHRAVDLGVAPSRPLVMELARVADAHNHQPVPDPLHLVLVAGEPGDRADRSRDEEESVRVLKRGSRE